MDIEKINNPIVKTVSEAEAFKDIPEVTDIIYDLRLLRITLKFPNIDNLVYVTFDGVGGFRVLDEGDLLEFWNRKTRTKGWLWRIEQGGWFDLERFRRGFVSGYSDDYIEYLILGCDDCVSVLAYDEPIIFAPKP